MQILKNCKLLNMAWQYYIKKWQLSLTFHKIDIKFRANNFKFICFLLKLCINTFALFFFSYTGAFYPKLRLSQNDKHLMLKAVFENGKYIILNIFFFFNYHVRVFFKKLNRFSGGHK